MFKIKILSVGKTKEAWLIDAMDEYIKRLTPLALIELSWFKDDQALQAAIEREDAVICLDPQGSHFTSEEFAQFFEKKLLENGSRLSLAIGGSDGFTSAVKKKYPLISLSRLTFTHQLTRLVLLEQIYRAFEILKGSKYHK